MERIVLGGGCFWCTEAMFKELDGVHEVKSGYSGGHTTDPTYKAVCSGSTGHAEVVAITYDANRITYKDLVMVHLLSHDPTTLNRQGADRGTQYRSIVFYQNEKEKQEAAKAIEEVQGLYTSGIVTELVPEAPFYEAEQAHQDYYALHSNAMYCKAVIDPKLNKFRTRFVALLKGNPTKG